MSGFHDENGYPVTVAAIENSRPLWSHWPEETSEEIDAALHAALALLTPKQRFVLECRYGWRIPGDEMRQADIAVLMGISQQQVSRLEERGVASLRRILSFPG